MMNSMDNKRMSPLHYILRYAHKDQLRLVIELIQIDLIPSAEFVPPAHLALSLSCLEYKQKDALECYHQLVLKEDSLVLQKNHLG